ncbi:MAG: SH3 domain-containing protein [Anaerolineae bacterium]|nr:SH3 domain-containing protein [Anaerolineae bacterium]
MSDRPQPDRLDDTQNPQGTQPVNLPEWNTPPAPLVPPRVPTPASGHVQQVAPRTAQPRSRAPRKRKTSDRSQSALYLPAWSVGVMLLLVLGIVGSIVMLVYTLGGQNAPSGEPRVVIITAAPSPTLAETAVVTPTTPPVEPLPQFQGPIPTFALEGPTLAPIILSPTPVEISIGATVIVNVDGLNIREAAGTSNKVVTFGNNGDRFTVVDGPQQASNLTWWQITDPDDPARTGWAASDYLDVAMQ